jgi:hypothetical protein
MTRISEQAAWRSPTWSRASGDSPLLRRGRHQRRRRSGEGAGRRGERPGLGAGYGAGSRPAGTLRGMSSICGRTTPPPRTRPGRTASAGGGVCHQAPPAIVSSRPWSCRPPRERPRLLARAWPIYDQQHPISRGQPRKPKPSQTALPVAARQAPPRKAPYRKTPVRVWSQAATFPPSTRAASTVEAPPGAARTEDLDGMVSAGRRRLGPATDAPPGRSGCA